MNLKLDPVSTVSNATWSPYSTDTGYGGTLYGNITKTGPVIVNFPYILSEHDNKSLIVFNLTNAEYYPVESCVINCRFMMHDKDAAGAAVTASSNVRNLVVTVKQNGTAIHTYTSPGLTNLTPIDYQASIPITSLAGWGGFTVDIYADGGVGGSNAAKRAIRVIWFALTFTMTTGESITIVPPKIPCKDVKAVWFHNSTLWGYNHTVFNSPVSGGIITGYAKFDYKQSGAFIKRNVYVRVNGAFVRVTNKIVTQVYLKSSFLLPNNTFVMTLLGDEFAYTVKLNDTMLNVLAYFRDSIRLMGYNCDYDTINNSLVVEGLAGYFIEIASSMLSNVRRHPRLNALVVPTAISDWSETWTFTTE